MSSDRYTDAETGFQYLRARYYDPATGQFLTRDPIEAQTPEAYGYVGGNPLNNVDPAGVNKCEVGANPLRWARNAGDCASKAGRVAGSGAVAAGRWAADHPTLTAGLAAGAVCLGTAGIGCTVATYGAATFSVGKSAYDNKIWDSDCRDLGRFGRDVAITGLFLGGGSKNSPARPAEPFPTPEPQPVKSGDYAVARTVQIYGSLATNSYGALIDYARSEN